MNRRIIAPIAGVVIVASIVAYWLKHRSARVGDDDDLPSVASMQCGKAVTAADYRLSGPYGHANLTIYLIHGPETLDAKSVLTLQEAMEQKKAVVNESGNVDSLSIENQSANEEVHVQSGDIVKGGKQDRTLPYDTLIAAQSGTVPIDSFCVEKSRWAKRGNEASDKFSSASFSLPTSEIKREAKSSHGSAQGEVWKSVAATQDRLTKKLGESAKSDTSATSLQLTLEGSAVQNAIAPYRTSLAAVLEKQSDVIGFVAAVNGRVVTVDVYASPVLFRKLWPKLLEGSAVEAFIEAEDGKAIPVVSETDIRRFLADAESGAACTEAVTERTYVQVRKSTGALLFDSCDRKRDNLVLHRSILVRKE